MADAEGIYELHGDPYILMDLNDFIKTVDQSV